MPRGEIRPTIRTRIASAPAPLSVALGFALIYLALIPPGIYSVDGNSMFYVADSLVSDLSVSVPCEASGGDSMGADGICYSIWYPLLSFLAVPFVAIGSGVGSLASVDSIYAAKLVALAVPALAAAGAAAVTAALATKLGASRRGSVGAAVAAALGTEILTYAGTFFTETLAAFLVALAVWGIVESGWRYRLALAAIGLVVLAKPTMFVIGPAISIVLAARGLGLRRAAAPLAATVAGSMLYGLYNWIRFSDPLEFGGPDRYAADNFLPPEVVEILGLLLVSPGKGLLWFSPIAVIGAILLWRLRKTATAQLCIAVSLAVLVVYIGHPYGGWDWGDRFLTPVLPLLCASLGTLRGRWVGAAVAVVAIGVASQIPNKLAFYERAYAENRAQGTPLERNRWSVERSPLVASWPAMANQLEAASTTDVNQLAVTAGGEPAESVEDEEMLRVVALWWWMLPVAGISQWAGLALSFLILAVGGRLLWLAGSGLGP